MHAYIWLEISESHLGHGVGHHIKPLSVVTIQADEDGGNLGWPTLFYQ